MGVDIVVGVGVSVKIWWLLARHYLCHSSARE